MFTTNINILKVLYQTKISKKNLMSDLNLTYGCLLKSIQQINLFLKDLEIASTIIFNENILSLNLSKKDWKKIFANLNEMSYEDRIDYLYIKFIYFGFINLEKEKEILDVSRSSINRYYSVVKKLLNINGSEIIYSNGKGNKIVTLSEYNKNIFVVKVMKLFLEEDILIKCQKELLNSIKNFNTKIRLSKLIAIYNSLKLPTSIYLLCFLCSIEVYTQKFGSFHINDFKNFSYEDSNIERIIKIVGYNFSDIYKKELYYFIIDISLNRHYYFEDIVCLSNIILKDLLNIFKINNNDELNTLLLQHIYMAIFKKKNNILKIRSTYFHSGDKIFLNKLDIILKKYNVELYLYDKHRIITDIKKEYLKIQTYKLKKVLILLNDIGTLKQLNLKSQLNYEFPNIHFDIEYNFLNNKSISKKNYDFCINDNELTLAKGDIIDRVKQQIEKYIVKNISTDKVN